MAEWSLLSGAQPLPTRHPLRGQHMQLLMIGEIGHRLV
jgi:hypothetical protein